MDTSRGPGNGWRVVVSLSLQPKGLAYTGRVITSAALILLVVIGAFAAGELVFVKEIGVGMAAAIIFDVTLVRALLVPAAMKLLGRRAWWRPGA
jgi:RND superfamily putative drug exporter